LFERIVQKEYYGEEDAQAVILRLANALQYCHSKGVVHRDLKPENILLASASDDAAIELCDFGFARTVDPTDANSLETACGTPGYVAPEVINGKKYGKEVDVWSLGVILYILLCGYPPFRQENRAKMFKAIRKGDYVFDSPWWDEVSDDAKDVVQRMLTVNAAERITLSQLMEHPWLKDSIHRDLTPALKELTKFNAKRRLKVGTSAVQAVQRLAQLGALAKKKTSSAA
jgi:calcium/calmodulin-dependent protein kinase I